MDHNRVTTAALRWGGLALAVQIWVALRFEEVARGYWIDSRRFFGGFRRFADRVSQLKPAAFKAPWSIFYTGLFVTLALTIIVALWVAGLRQAIAPDSEREDDGA